MSPRNPGLKAGELQAMFRGLKPSAPSDFSMLVHF